MIAMLLQCFHKDRNAGHRVTIAVMCYITIKFSRETGDGPYGKSPILYRGIRVRGYVKKKKVVL